MSVSTQPGHIALTVIPRGASSSANVRVNPMTPCFVAEYAPRPATPNRPTTEDRLMIRAPSERCGRASRVTRNTAVRFVARIASQNESSRSESGVGPPRPALLTRTSIRPHFSTTAEIIRAIAGASVTSAAIAIAPPPDASISRAIRWHESSLLAARATRAPSCAKRREIASPIPREAPVTRATFPSSRWPSGTTVPSLAGDARKGGIPAAGAGELDGKGKMDVFLDGDEVLHLPRAERLQLRDHLIDEELRRRGPGGHAHGVRSFEPGRIDPRRIVDEICPRSRENGLFDEPVRVGRVLRADQQDHGRPPRERGGLSRGRRRSRSRGPALGRVPRRTEPLAPRIRARRGGCERSPCARRAEDRRTRAPGRPRRSPARLRRRSRAARRAGPASESAEVRSRSRRGGFYGPSRREVSQQLALAPFAVRRKRALRVGFREPLHHETVEDCAHGRRRGRGLAGREDAPTHSLLDDRAVDLAAPFVEAGGHLAKAFPARRQPAEVDERPEERAVLRRRRKRD